MVTISKFGATENRRAPIATSTIALKESIALMNSEHREPINLGQDRMISINELVDMVSKIAGKKIWQELRSHQATGRSWKKTATTPS